ncbi:hypothetical protein [Bosea sp. 117]|uniref:hypothetical protein n=1 Tax=Bosea sp. 117 TaxID=1125973 RepID=UPI00049456FF|nr:hypothetical protein [Bosea sp. 117]
MADRHAPTTPEPIAFGVAGLPPAFDPRAPRGVPLARVRPGEVLRLNDEALDLPPPALGDEETALDARVIAHLKRLSGGWNRGADAFLDGYFMYLREAVARNRAAIEERLAPFDSLFRPEDVLWSAPLPLPRAFLSVPPPAEAVAVDFAFWLGERELAVLLAPSALTPGAERRRRERLDAAGIGVATFDAAACTDGARFAALLGAQARFWESDALPAAPGAVRLPDF